MFIHLLLQVREMYISAPHSVSKYLNSRDPLTLEFYWLFFLREMLAYFLPDWLMVLVLFKRARFDFYYFVINILRALLNRVFTQAMLFATR